MNRDREALLEAAAEYEVIKFLLVGFAERRQAEGFPEMTAAQIQELADLWGDLAKAGDHAEAVFNQVLGEGLGNRVNLIPWQTVMATRLDYELAKLAFAELVMASHSPGQQHARDALPAAAEQYRLCRDAFEAVLEAYHTHTPLTDEVRAALRPTTTARELDEDTRECVCTFEDDDASCAGEYGAPRFGWRRNALARLGRLAMQVLEAWRLR